jgi:TPR repeat protein
MRNVQSLIMLFLAAAFAVNLYAAETPEIKYNEARAIQLFNNGDCDNAFQLFQQVAAKGDATAQYYIGRMYFNGEVTGEDVDYAKAFTWFQKAAMQGNAKAQASLGRMYFLGHGIAQNFDKAMMWYQKAADQGNAHGQYGLACIYYRVKFDYPMAMKWYQKAAEQDNPYAQYSLACMYYYGEGSDKDFKQALKWFKAAADQNIPPAQYDLGVMYLKGQSVQQSDGIAEDWFRKAAGSNYKAAVAALQDMGVDYQSGVPAGNEASPNSSYQRPANDEYQPYNTGLWLTNSYYR